MLSNSYSRGTMLIAMVACSLQFFANEIRAEQPDIVISRVSIAGPPGATNTQLMDLHITDGKLIQIAPHDETISMGEGALDANSWTAIGTFQLKAPANFVVLRGNADSNFELLRDTRSNAAFVIHDGAVLHNELHAITLPASTVANSTKNAVYTASDDIEEEAPWYAWQTKNTSNLFVVGIILDRVDWLSQNNVSKNRLDDLSSFDGGEIRDFRFGATGDITYFERPWTYTFFVATNAFDKDYDVNEGEDLSIYDLRLDVPTSDRTYLAIGKQKEPISGDRMQSAVFNHMQERAAVSDALLKSRNTGVAWYGYDPERTITWGAGVFNDWLEDNDNSSNAETTVAGRLSWAPYIDSAKDELLHLGIGHRWSDVSRGARYAAGPEVFISPRFVDTAHGNTSPRFEADSASTSNAELSWQSGSLWIASEYTRTEVDSSEYGDPVFDGYWVAASWIFGGVSRPYNKKRGLFGAVPIASRVDQGGKGTLEVSGRWSNVDLTDGRISGGDMDVASLGLAWWLTPHLGLDLDFHYTWTSFPGSSETATAVNSRILLLLE